MEFLDYNTGLETFFEKYVAEEDRKYYKGRASISHIVEELRSKGTYAFTFHMMGKDKELLLKKTTYCFLDAANECILTVLEDITEINRKEQKHMDKLKNALLRVEQATEAKTSFFANISHDMRTPLNGVLGFVGLAVATDNIQEKTNI